MNSTSSYHPPIVFHPGETLAEKLAELKMGPDELALHTGIPEETILGVVEGTTSITPEMAVQFEPVLLIPAQLWLSLQKMYDGE